MHEHTLFFVLLTRRNREKGVWIIHILVPKGQISIAFKDPRVTERVALVLV
jgi:hypothetical protein